MTEVPNDDEADAIMGRDYIRGRYTVGGLALDDDSGDIYALVGNRDIDLGVRAIVVYNSTSWDFDIITLPSFVIGEPGGIAWSVGKAD